MAPDVLARAFERSSRGDQARARTSGGSGLGLSIVNAVARAHGGQASVSCPPEGGTRVVVALPQGPASP